MMMAQSRVSRLLTKMFPTRMVAMTCCESLSSANAVLSPLVPCSNRLTCDLDKDIRAVSEPEKKAEKLSRTTIPIKGGTRSNIYPAGLSDMSRRRKKL